MIPFFLVLSTEATEWNFSGVRPNLCQAAAEDVAQLVTSASGGEFMGDVGLAETTLPHLALMMATDNMSSSLSTWCEQRRPHGSETARKKEGGRSASEPTGGAG